LAALAGLNASANSASAVGPACACTAGGGCTDGGPIAPYTDGNDPMNLAGDGNQYNLGEGAPAQTGSFISVNDAAGAYIDSAIVGSRFRLRFDAGYNNPLPDRGEFFYGQCGCFGPGAPGPLLPETDVDYQELTPYLEWAYSNQLSFFVEAPVRFINPEQNDNTAGLGDLNGGFKYAFIACPDEYLTAQLRVYAPTGDADRGLGTGHASIEPAILYFRRLTDSLVLQAEVRDWIPISDNAVNGQNFASNIIRYGVGFGYDLMQNCNECDPCSTDRLTLVGEFVGWTLTNGLALNGFNAINDPNVNPVEDQAGVTIVNAKIGLRYTVGADSLYMGYGTALTNQTWYEDILRFEYIRAF
jgi:hypothetical protein